MAVGGLTTGQGKENRITTKPNNQNQHTMTTILGVTAVLLLLANILQAVAAMNAKQDIRALNLSLFRTEKERDKAKAEAKQADRLRDECEKTMRAAIEENDRMMTEQKDLYYRNSKGQIAKLHP